MKNLSEIEKLGENVDKLVHQSDTIRIQLMLIFSTIAFLIFQNWIVIPYIIITSILTHEIPIAYLGIKIFRNKKENQ